MKLRALIGGLALLATGTVIGITTQQFASADISSGDRPVLVPIESCRLIDTRPAFQVGPRDTPLGPAATLTLDTQQASTECTGKIPAGASAIAANITAPDATGNGFITTWSGGDRPNTSTLNPQPGQLVFNATTLNLDGTKFNIYNNAGNTNIIIDITGYYDNHNHDDRYYTETEVDAAIDAANVSPGEATISIPVTALKTDSGANLGYSSATGAILESTGTNFFGTTFVIPQDHRPGTLVFVDIFVYNPSANGACQAVILSNGGLAWRPGEPRDKTSVFGFASSFPAFTQGDQTYAHTFRFGEDKGAGDIINFSMFRHGNVTEDTCGDVDLVGMQIRYERG